VNIIITTLGVDLKTTGGRLVFGVMCQIAEFEREQIRERVIAGMVEAKKRADPNKMPGRKHKLSPHQRSEAVRMHVQENKTLSEIAAMFGCGRTVVHRAINGEERVRKVVGA
jgi:DNA invertase Pin-like site-specific DNA recombinase